MFVNLYVVVNRKRQAAASFTNINSDFCCFYEFFIFIHDRSLSLKDLNAVILAVAHQNISVRHDANTLESFEF